MKSMMTFTLPRFFASAAAALLLVQPGSLRAGGAAIHDEAGFFSERAKADAGYLVTELQRTMHKDVCVETFAAIPEEFTKGVNLQDKLALNKAVNTWAVQRARSQGVNGVYIVLVKQPAHLQALVGNDTQKRAFTLSDRDQLVNLMLTKLRAKDYDGALREGLGFVASTMRTHGAGSPRAVSGPVSARHGEAAASSSGGGWLLPLIIVGVIAWVIIGIIRSLTNRGSVVSGGNAMPGMMGGGGVPGQSGGFMRNMLGGMFGSMAGMWMYDQFFGNHGSSYGAPPPSDSFGGGGGSFDSGFTGQDTDFSGSGGSFGDDAGGGFGGGDFGGGGDSGGGGDF